MEERSQEQGISRDKADSVKEQATYTEEFAAEQPFHEEGWDEEAVPLSGEIYSYDTYFANENELADPSYSLGNSKSETMDLSASEDDPFDPYRSDEFARQSKLNAVMADSRTEFASELAPSPGYRPAYVPKQEIRHKERSDSFFTNSNIATPNDGQETPVRSRSSAIGWIAIVLAVASLFYWPIVLGPAAAVMGVIAYFQGNRSLGVWSVVLGLLSLLAFLFLIPYYS